MELTKWERGNLRKPEYKLVAVRVNLENEKDIIEALEKTENISGYIKALIRKDIQPHD